MNPANIDSDDKTTTLCVVDWPLTDEAHGWNRKQRVANILRYFTSIVELRDRLCQIVFIDVEYIDNLTDKMNISNDDLLWTRFGEYKKRVEWSGVLGRVNVVHKTAKTRTMVERLVQCTELKCHYDSRGILKPCDPSVKIDGLAISVSFWITVKLEEGKFRDLIFDKKKQRVVYIDHSCSRGLVCPSVNPKDIRPQFMQITFKGYGTKARVVTVDRFNEDSAYFEALANVCAECGIISDDTVPASDDDDGSERGRFEVKNSPVTTPVPPSPGKRSLNVVENLDTFFDTIGDYSASPDEVELVRAVNRCSAAGSKKARRAIDFGTSDATANNDDASHTVTSQTLDDANDEPYLSQRFSQLSTQSSSSSPVSLKARISKTHIVASPEDIVDVHQLRTGYINSMTGGRSGEITLIWFTDRMCIRTSQLGKSITLATTQIALMFVNELPMQFNKVCDCLGLSENNFPFFTSCTVREDGQHAMHVFILSNFKLRQPDGVDNVIHDTPMQLADAIVGGGRQKIGSILIMTELSDSNEYDGCITAFHNALPGSHIVFVDQNPIQKSKI